MGGVRLSGECMPGPGLEAVPCPAPLVPLPAFCPPQRSIGGIHASFSGMSKTSSFWQNLSYFLSKLGSWICPHTVCPHFLHSLTMPMPLRLFLLTLKPSLSLRPRYLTPATTCCSCTALVTTVWNSLLGPLPPLHSSWTIESGTCMGMGAIVHVCAG